MDLTHINEQGRAKMVDVSEKAETERIGIARGHISMLPETFARIFYRNSINIGLPIIECPEAAKNIEAGDQVEIDFDSGMIYNRTKGTEFKGQAFPEFMQKIIAAEGLINYINNR